MLLVTSPHPCLYLALLTKPLLPSKVKHGDQSGAAGGDERAEGYWWTITQMSCGKYRLTRRCNHPSVLAYQRHRHHCSGMLAHARTHTPTPTHTESLLVSSLSTFHNKCFYSSNTHEKASLSSLRDLRRRRTKHVRSSVSSFKSTSCCWKYSVSNCGLMSPVLVFWQAESQQQHRDLIGKYRHTSRNCSFFQTLFCIHVATWSRDTLFRFSTEKRWKMEPCGVNRILGWWIEI